MRYPCVEKIMILDGYWGSVEAEGRVPCLIFLFTLAAGEIGFRSRVGVNGAVVLQNGAGSDPGASTGKEHQPARWL